ncbi:hypothetical protein [Pontibacter pamirensis]|uniref:hypothetical protein n=1 Tax=Pontibacter pamirensis TaxID=2562824 RepID=UPI0013895C92|nr:hypothetical protein [Pontibacter pamirensis]
MVAITNIVQSELPVVEDFINAEILSRTEKVFRSNSQIEFEVKEKEQIYWLSAKAYKQEKLSFESIGNIGVPHDNEEQHDYDIMFFWSYMASFVKQEVNYGSLRTGRKVSEIIKIDL